ncbi:YggS family pyridoxal phosphate-dependent enzyme [Christensenella tenuis]|uniref:Pyridoxal phosphate homeostasis protein n=1 Tax=Christensenella tenuis TaxID=2763033 RepID=A0ABR7EAY6_9FIRM|nr:YggS family pyridoxal phosphate-dependent enzyme [Christensenella tenuis]MBC5646921.1 YggS family pyridoxal phosphate-dependent enzyme [Christensenella tenuis]
MGLSENITAVRQKIAFAADRAGRKAEDVTLVAVSKTVDTETVEAAYREGLRCFGENRVQEYLKKSEALPSDIKWNLIGQLQTNKVKYIINNGVALLHSLDRLSLAQELQKECVKKNTSIDALIEVNIAKEESKSGLYLEQVDAFLDEIADFDRICLKGFMTVAPYTEDRTYLRKIFAQAKTLYDAKKKDFPGFKYLSMGMSNDYEDAILEGSNMVRVGTAIFGSRIYK